jgi:hypothetical protein
MYVHESCLDEATQKEREEKLKVLELKKKA